MKPFFQGRGSKHSKLTSSGRGVVSKLPDLTSVLSGVVMQYYFLCETVFPKANYWLTFWGRKCFKTYKSTTQTQEPYFRVSLYNFFGANFHFFMVPLWAWEECPRPPSLKPLFKTLNTPELGRYIPTYVFLYLGVGACAMGTLLLEAYKVQSAHCERVN